MGNTIIASADALFPLGAQPVSDEAVRVVEEEDGPKGVMMMYNRAPGWNMVLENPLLGLKARGTNPYYLRTSMYCPGCCWLSTGRFRVGRNTNGTFPPTRAS